MISVIDRSRRFAEIRDLDIQSETEFLAKYDAQNAELLARIKDMTDDCQGIWTTQMEILITKTEDSEWLTFLTGEMRLTNSRTVECVERWISVERERMVLRTKLDNRRSGEQAVKKFIQGLPSAERLEALIAERDAIKNRTSIDLLTKKMSDNKNALKQIQDRLPQTVEVFTHIFERAIR